MARPLSTIRMPKVSDKLEDMKEDNFGVQLGRIGARLPMFSNMPDMAEPEIFESPIDSIYLLQSWEAHLRFMTKHTPLRLFMFDMTNLANAHPRYRVASDEKILPGLISICAAAREQGALIRFTIPDIEFIPWASHLYMRTLRQGGIPTLRFMIPMNSLVEARGEYEQHYPFTTYANPSIFDILFDFRPSKHTTEFANRWLNECVALGQSPCFKLSAFDNAKEWLIKNKSILRRAIRPLIVHETKLSKLSELDEAMSRRMGILEFSDFYQERL